MNIMISKIKKFLLGILLFIMFIPMVMADSVDTKKEDEEKNLVNIYLFYSYTCPHCKEEEKLLEELKDKYDNIRVYQYEVSSEENSLLLDKASEIFNTSVSGVPFTVIGEKVYKGFNYENARARFMGTIEYYSEYGYVDKLGEYIGDIELPSYSVLEDRPDLMEYMDDYTNYKIKVPLIGVVETKNLTLPIIAILIGLVDGFNPCAMWVLLFLISMLIGMKDKKKMVVLGTVFLGTSALIYLLFMVAWLNVATLLISVKYVRLVIGLVAVFGALYNLVSYFRHRKETGCNVVDDKKRNKIFERIKKFTHEENFFLAILGVMALALSVNIVELACSAGLPVMFTQILSMNNLTIIEEVLYIALYMLFFLIDDLLIFFIAVRTMEVSGVSTKYGKASKLIGGILLLIIGVLMIFKPEWLMFNF